jgi:hypothetical protein
MFSDLLVKKGNRDKVQKIALKKENQGYNSLKGKFSFKI